MQQIEGAVWTVNCEDSVDVVYALQCVLALPVCCCVFIRYMHMGAVLIPNDPWVYEACGREAMCRGIVISNGLVPLQDAKH